MSSDQLDDVTTSDDDGLEPTGGDETQPLHLTVDIEPVSACERHVTVTIAREDIDRYCDEAFSEMMPSSTVPGFRPGRAPRKLVEHRYRKEVLEKVKNSLLIDSMGQVSEEQNLTAIGEPDFDLEAVDVPEEGPMTFEFDLEVRPEFDMPEWKGLTVQRPVREFSDSDVDRRIQQLLSRYGQLEPCDRKARPDDYLSVRITTLDDDGQEIAVHEDLSVRAAPVLSFRDGKIDGFDKLIDGASEGETRETELDLSADAPNESQRGKRITVRIEILEVKQLKLPELTPDFLEEIGDFASEEELREVIRKDFERQLHYRQNQQIRQQISAALTASANWDLPPGLLKRQSARELERLTLELRRSGFSEEEIVARGNELRQNSAVSTAASLKEHFILERIAEEENIDTDADDYDHEVALISSQSGDSPRRVRAHLEKRGLMDVLRNQIIERKVIDLVRSHAQFKDVPLPQDQPAVEAVEVAVAGGDEESSIPEITQGGDGAEQSS
ncbi:MAG: trigger factor [Pirellulales bacterium]